MVTRLVLASLVFAVSAMVTTEASAQTAGDFMANPAFQDPPPDRCDSTFEMQHCAAHELRKADALMGTQYRKLRARLGPAARQRLLTEQRRWLGQRDRGCLAKGNRYRGGTLSPVVVAQCWADVTKARYRVLLKYR